MIDELVVRNLGVIRDARLDFGPGFTVVTGETGAGKTLLLGALRMLLGADARSDLVGPFGDEAVVEGRFLRGDTEVGAGRRLRKEGRSRAYLDGSIASADALDAAASGIVDIISQNDQLSITRPSEVRVLVDRNLDDDGKAAAEAYRVAWVERIRLEADQRALGGDRPALERERLAATYDAETIAGADLEPGEDEVLETRLARLRNAEQIRSLAADAATYLDRSRDDLGTAVGILRRLAALDAGSGSLAEEAGNAESVLDDAAAGLVRLVEDLELDQTELEAAEQRQSILTELLRRYGPTLDDVITFGMAQARRAEELQGLLERADQIDEELAAADRRLQAAGTALRDARRRAAKGVADRALAHLRELGFSRPAVTIQVDEAQPTASGADTAAVVFASDDRLDPGPVARIASGGELSRLVLALRLAAGTGATQTVVFDEIDSGVGGQTAIAIGAKLADLAKTQQVLCVTHLPQVAAFADTHWVVEREGEEASVRRVDGEARVEELTRMLAGIPESAHGREAAHELLVMAGRRGIQ